MVREWSGDEGWGVIDSDATPGGCWLHFSMLRVAGHKTVSVGSLLEFTYEQGRQDGFDFRAEAAWPVGEQPVDDTIVVTGPSAAYSSELRIWFDDPADED